MKVIFISGPPASGKSTIRNQLSKPLNIDSFSKDMFKEKLFDTNTKSKYLHWNWYDKTAYKQLFEKLEQNIEANRDIIIESNFIPHKEKKDIAKFLNPGLDIREVHCSAKGWTLLKRFVSRNETKSRPRQKHKEHHDRIWYPYMTYMAIARFFRLDFPHTRLDLSENTLVVDTSDFNKLDIEKIINFCK